MLGDAIGSFDVALTTPLDMPDVEDAPVVPKKEHSRELSLSSISSPGAEHEADLDGQASPQQNVQVQKRKGGRKPVRCFLPQNSTFVPRAS